MTRDVLSVWPETLITNPRPWLDEMNSAPTVPTIARPEACRRPVMMYGTLPGRTIVRKVSRLLAPKVFATLRNRASVACTPAIVLSVMKKITPRNTTQTLNVSPRPNHRMKIGTNARSGAAYSAWSHGCAM